MVHHTKVKQARDIGCYIQVTDDRRFRIFWPERSVELFGNTVDECLSAMKKVQLSVLENPDAELPKVQPDEEHIGGIPKDGGRAYREGVPASDCPYDEGTVAFNDWNDSWDNAADEAGTEESVVAEEPIKGSVVTNRYRAQYSEMGHPTHCGDALATLLNSICVNKAGTNLELFERICEANGVNLAKYNRTTKGWQGRLRMTGRNLLAKQVLKNDGVLNMPEGLGQDQFKLDEDWKERTSQKYKPKRFE